MHKIGKLSHGGISAPITTAWSAPRCGARRKHDGKPCQQPGMRNGRCRFHGGMSTGPRTAEGRKRISEANTKHGRYSKAAREANAQAREAMTELGWPRRLYVNHHARWQRRDPVTGRFV